MPQPPPSPWKRAAFTAIARVEHALRGRSVSPQSDLRQVPNFLVLQYETPLGSIVHATPVFEALKIAAPHAHITVAASSMAANVLAHSPHIHRCVVTPNPFTDFTRALTTLRELLQGMPPGPRCILTTVGNQRTRLALLGLLSGTGVRAGYTLAPELYDIPLSFTPERGQIESNLDILRALGHKVAFCEPRVFFTRHDADLATQLLQSIPEKYNAPRIAFVIQNSRGQKNQWKAESFQRVVATLSQTYSTVPVFLGTSFDAGPIEILRRSLPDAGISLAGKTTIPQLAAVLAQCDLIVSLDTGTFHVARAVGLPGVVIAPAWQSPLEWLPVHHPHYRVLRGPSLTTVPSNYSIEEISAEQVSAAARNLLDLYPSAPAHRAARLQTSLCG